MKMTIQQLSTTTNISEGTIRSWIMKPIIGEIYSSESINYNNLREKLGKYFDKFDETFGFAINDLEIIKTERSTKVWMTSEEIVNLLEGNKVILHNYSLKTELVFVGIAYDLTTFPNETIRVFRTKDNQYKAYSAYDLSKECIKLELIK